MNKYFHICDNIFYNLPMKMMVFLIFYSLLREIHIPNVVMLLHHLLAADFDLHMIYIHLSHTVRQGNVQDKLCKKFHIANCFSNDGFSGYANVAACNNVQPHGPHTFLSKTRFFLVFHNFLLFYSIVIIPNQNQMYLMVEISVLVGLLHTLGLF